MSDAVALRAVPVAELSNEDARIEHALYELNSGIAALLVQVVWHTSHHASRDVLGRHDTDGPAHAGLAQEGLEKLVASRRRECFRVWHKCMETYLRIPSHGGLPAH